MKRSLNIHRKSTKTGGGILDDTDDESFQMEKKSSTCRSIGIGAMFLIGGLICAGGVVTLIAQAETRDSALREIAFELNKGDEITMKKPTIAIIGDCPPETRECWNRGCCDDGWECCAFWCCKAGTAKDKEENNAFHITEEAENQDQ